MRAPTSFGRVLERWREQRLHQGVTSRTIDVVDVEVLCPGRPGVIDVVAEMDGRLAHAVLAIRRPGDHLRILGAVEEPTLGTIEDDDGVGLAVDALHDPDAARLVLGAVAGTSPVTAGPGSRRATATGPVARSAPSDVSKSVAGRRDVPVVSMVHEDDETTALAFDRRCTLTVFCRLTEGPHPGTTLLSGLDEAGFNHLAAPIAFWRRSGRDLGVVQELLAGASSGWALAVSSLRDVIASGVSPDVAGGDFAPEAFALGTMAARMHMALDHAFGRQVGDLAAWADLVGTDLLAAAAGAAPGGLESAVSSAGALLEELRGSGLHPAIRTHGDLHLGRTARTDHGWVLADCMPGGTLPGSTEPVFRSPLADVADLTWSLHHAAVVAANERGPMSAPTRAGELAAAWEARNRRALVAAYLATPGIGGLVPADRRVVRRLLRLFELGRGARGGWSTAPAR